MIRRTGGTGEFLIVRRPLDDDSLPGEWGLPAVTLRQGEMPEAAVRRLGKEKLGVEIEPTRFVGIEHADRGFYRLILMDIEARIISGDPQVRAARTAGTRYLESRWSSDPAVLRPAAEKGSLCCAILLREGSA